MYILYGNELKGNEKMEREKLIDKDYRFDKKLKKYKDWLVSIFTDVGEHKRDNPKHTKMSSLLLIHENLTQKALKNLTGYSTGSISTYLSVMQGDDNYKKELIPGTHTYKYQYGGKVEDLTTNRLNDALKSILKSKIYLEKKKEELGVLIKQKKEGARHLSQRIDEILRAYEFLSEYTS